MLQQIYSQKQSIPGGKRFNENDPSFKLSEVQMIVKVARQAPHFPSVF